ncbi:dTDP-glucose 4,6-dehydratase [Lacticaseibacillus casei]|jgi:dTDP-glucose 4,6-dehydratase|uniref:dTDP-glucose 4,6-dehydratase n=1 Tax=Lacticaseibacillus huelsenbergensis TaxID=3035291 RepID=A0ABY8DWV2_9LACO|nr:MULTISPECIES: dTDP-glucose 4,6-dehydratase [Lacticaseibacillus]MDG3060899.1 dTDP-glucose 4,6-dehydratase [Lacticaseibacillus sp. BCRC 81376]QVI37317.1 dTDP-glucose 4,6-dehydratase [Lacticaseibacillus casei]QXG59107.1 dTDP-glucose 4,6-dehydratase [Lacticaseibacillus casei]WFB39441.1 dTDP-glucose 4,6-dehydratase [Lacticaseibacillus huelsenbergensis]WFB41143.1 dTDP-glucose 4,6-dehydratase [Lacticaseibacillus huelsenbergensis]
MNLLVTGGAGFIGSNFVRFQRQNHPEDLIVNLDLLTYAGNLQNLADLQNDRRYIFVHGNIVNRELVAYVIEQYHIDAIVNFAAESHVDRSIQHPEVFYETNVKGTLTLLSEAKRKHLKFLQISTDEVYGSLGKQGYFTEKSALQPNSPYAASKASADMSVRAFYETYKVDVNITRSSNNYGPYQFPEKLIPLMITHGLTGKQLPIYGNGKNIRDWLYVEDNCRALDLVLRKGQAGEIYNVGGHNERSNNTIVQNIVDHLGLSKDRIEYVEDRLGHDKRYAIDSTKISLELGWKPITSFDAGLDNTINWYITHRNWWNLLLDKAKF